LIILFHTRIAQFVKAKISFLHQFSIFKKTFSAVLKNKANTNKAETSKKSSGWPNMDKIQRFVFEFVKI